MVNIRLILFFSFIILNLLSCHSDTPHYPEYISLDIQPYTSLEQAVLDIEKIDWDNDSVKARSITMAFAAKEIVKHFKLIGVDLKYVPISQSASVPHILLTIEPEVASNFTEYNKDSVLQSYSVKKFGNHVEISSPSRIGILYGSYRYLEKEGFAWYDHKEVNAPSVQAHNESYQFSEIPKSTYRGFWLYNSTPLSNDYLLWMARNRLNLVGKAPADYKKMLGFKTWRGGHHILQEVFSKPGLFEKHNDWFAFSLGEYQKIPPTGTYYNPSFANLEVANYFSEQIIERLSRGDLKDVDILNVWPSDTRQSHSFDQSDRAKQLGNRTDNLLFFYLNVAKALDNAYTSGDVNRKVKLGGISYFTTWDAPERLDISSQLAKENYVHVFYLNERTWQSPLFDQREIHQSNNTIYYHLSNWLSHGQLDFGTVDYYNYSGYAAVALTDYVNFEKTNHSLRHYNEEIVAYMHSLYQNPGPRRLTNQLLAKVSWRSCCGESTDIGDTVADKYFRNRYGNFALKWKEIYEKIALSVDNVKEIFGDDSLTYHLFKPVFWEGEEWGAKDIDTFQMYRKGGVQKLPLVFQKNTLTESFRGLDESISMLRALSIEWQAVRSEVNEPLILERIDSDIVWFNATLNRYILTGLLVDYVTLKVQGIENLELKKQIEEKVLFLESSSVTKDTISPVDQRWFLGMTRKLISI